MKRNFIIALFIVLVSGPSSANLNDAFLENINGVIQMEFSDGSLYRGQVGECVIDLDVTTCMHGKGIYILKAGSKYMGDFLNNKPPVSLELLSSQLIISTKHNKNIFAYLIL